MILRLIARSKPMSHSFQGALPKLPLPSLDDTVQQHLISMRPLCTDEEYNELIELSEKFRRGIGRRLQRYLTVKSYLSINYVTDWWEEFVYMRQRSPLMINSNYYGFDLLNYQSTNVQAARAASLTAIALSFRRKVERQEISPFSIAPSSNVPFCVVQYERLFNSCRIPGEEADQFCHWEDSKHIAVYCRGSWFRLPVHNGKRLYEAAELQQGFQAILNDEPILQDGVESLAALTAGDRKPWAYVREKHFSFGLNKKSLDTIERSAFVVVLEDSQVYYDPNDSSKLDLWACKLLHGSGTNRWFDKSFNLIVFKNGRMGLNVEHSWGDAPITSHFLEYSILTDFFQMHYDEHGNVRGCVGQIPKHERLQWKMNDDIQLAVKSSLCTAKYLIDDVEMALLVWNDFGKGYIKSMRVSPDAFLQMALQLTYYRNQGHFSLTYEASTTRLYREGRTETIRSCTNESCDFVRSMLDHKQTNEERLRLLRIACVVHRDMVRNAMAGKGVDRHLFALYIVRRYLEEESPYLDKIFPPTYQLSTSQTPINQCEDQSIISKAKEMNLITGGGGFGPVADCGYGVSYIIIGEHVITFHISSKKSADNTSSTQFRSDLTKTLREMHSLLSR